MDTHKESLSNRSYFGASRLELLRAISGRFYDFKASIGGLICRGVISKLKNHNIDTFISLSAPLNGQYGETDYIRDTMPNVPKKETYWKLFYTKIGQRASVGGYWRDPFHLKEYVKWSNFLAPLNGESGNGSTMNHRASFLKVSPVRAPHGGTSRYQTSSVVLHKET